jgi:hypothetical protein
MTEDSQKAGYLGESDEFDKAVAKYAIAYADRAERDYELLREACRSGRIKATIEEDSD